MQNQKLINFLGGFLLKKILLFVFFLFSLCNVVRANNATLIKEKFDDVFIKIVFDQIKNTLNIFITNPGVEQKGHILLTLNTVIYKIDDYSVVLFTS